MAVVMSMREWLLVMGEQCRIQPADGRDRGRDASSDRGERKGNADVGVAALFRMLTRNKGGIGVRAELSTERRHSTVVDERGGVDDAVPANKCDGHLSSR